MTLTTLSQSTPTSRSQLRRAIQMRERVAEACRLVASRRTVRGVHIVAKGELSDDEIRQFQELALTYHVNLSVDSHGTISVRPSAWEEE